MARNFRVEDHGKDVVDHGGNHVGTLSFTGDNDEYAEMQSSPGITEGIKQMLGWGDDDRGELRNEHVDQITEEEVKLRRRRE
jgi:hypothetical protein